MPALRYEGKALRHGGKRLLAPAVVGAKPPVGGIAASTVSGASGNSAQDGTFATWRGTPVAITGTWNDDNANSMMNQWSINPRYGNVMNADGRHIDVGIGAIASGETWAQAAAGNFDSRWATAMNFMADGMSATNTGGWGNFKANQGASHRYVRFGHEFNLGGAYPWEVAPGNEANYIAGWRRFYGVFHDTLTSRGVRDRAHLVWCPNHDSNNGLDIQNCHPGSEYVDLHGVDYYNTEYHWVGSVGEWDAQILKTQNGGSPLGIERHRLFAESKGLPFSLGEWGNRMTAAGAGFPAANGDGRIWIEQMRNWQTTHAGNTAGKLMYEIYFNDEYFGTTPPNPAVYELYPHTSHQPTADRYAALW